jgi:ribosomal protein S18 acetylase RimI-like enzyme
MKFKKVTQEVDLEFIIRAQILMAKETEDMDLDPETVRKGVNHLFNNNSFGDYYCVTIDGKNIGCLLTTYEWSDWRNGICLWIQSVYVLPEFRAQGVFKLMYSELKNKVINNDQFTGLRLYVDKTNTNAQKIYEKVGMSNEHYELYEWLR